MAEISLAQQVGRLGDRAVHKARRSVKYARRWLQTAITSPLEDRKLVLIMGAQRSGTRVPLLALDRSPGIVTYREGAHPFFQGSRLRAPEVIDGLFRRSPFPVLVLKPLCDSHRATEFLQMLPSVRVVWIFRHFTDTVRSASLKWSSGALAVRQLVKGELSPDDWRSGGVTEDVMAEVRHLYQPGLSLNHANAILWLLRNRIALDQRLFENPRVLVVKYEDLAGAPFDYFPALFRFVGQPVKPKYLHGIHHRSIARRPLADVPGDVVDACESLYLTLEERYRRASSLRGQE